MKYFTINTPGASLANFFAENSNRKQLILQFMRIGFIYTALLLSTMQLLLALPVKGQKISAVEVRLELRNETLLSAFKKIEKQTSFRFVYRKGELMTLPSKNISASTYTVEEVLNLLLTDTDLSYKQVDNNVLIQTNSTRSSRLDKSEEIEDPVADITIRGQVTDTKGETLPGVSIKLKGTTVGATTGLDGRYTINVPEKNSVLVFTYIGYLTQEITVNNQTSINIKLETANTALTEVVVTALGIKRSVKSLTYSAQMIDGSSMNEAKETNVINSLQGKVAGVVISRSATGPGGSSKVLLRGSRSITGGNEPLYVMDGVPVSGSGGNRGAGSFGGRDSGGGISMINPDNIESMTVLKGASAAALYGSAGQNGAIVITTKSGKSGKLTLDYNGGITFDEAIALPERQDVYGQGDGGVFFPNSEHSWGAKTDGHMVTLWNGNSVSYSAQPNNIQNFLRTAQTLTNSISATGGNDKMRTFFSYGNVRADGILRNNDMTRHNIDFKLDNNLSEKFSFTTKISYIYQDINNMPATGEAGYALSSIYRSPISIPLSEMQNFAYMKDGVEFQNYWKPGSSVLSNPYWNLNRELFKEKKDRVLGLFSAKYAFNSWIDFQLRGSIDKTMTNSDNKIYNDTYTTYGLGSNYIVQSGMSQGTNVDALISLRHDLTKKINLSANLGGALQQGHGTSTYISANGLNKQNYFYLVNARNPLTSNGYGQSPQVQSLYGTATLSYNDYLFLEATARNDWSSALPMGNESYFYPSVGVTGIVSEMMSLPSWVTYGKIRASLAYSGSGGGAYLDRNYYYVSRGGLIGTPSNRSLPTYKPELTSAFEAGAEWRFFNGRVGFDFTYYTTDTKNQLIVISTPAASLFSSQYINAGLINNKGVEATLRLTPVQTKDFSWDASFNFAKNNNKIIRLTDEVTKAIIVDDRQVIVQAAVGGSYGDMFAVGWQRDAQGRPLVTNAGMPMLTGGKTVAVGNYNPNYNLGFYNTFEFKKLSLGFLLDYRNGGTVIAGTQALLDADGHSKASLRGREGGIVLDAYTADGQKNTTSITSQNYFAKIGERYPAGEFYAYSGTNLRLRELVLGYSIPNNLLSQTGFISGAKIALVGRNLFFLQREAPFDPELVLGTGNAAGMEYNSLPSTRNIGLNLKLTF